MKDSFTQIELLVAISIIVVLIPVLALSTEQSHGAVCVFNLYHEGILLYTYALDYIE